MEQISTYTTAAPDGGGESGRFGAALAVYSLDLLVGGLYVGMAAPVRTVVQALMGLGYGAGIWLINIYTLFYAALIPVIGKVGTTVAPAVFVGLIESAPGIAGYQRMLLSVAACCAIAVLVVLPYRPRPRD